MKHPILTLLIAGLTAALVSAQETYPLRKAVECAPRSGLPNVLAKLEAGKAVKVAYLGGSITAAAGWRIKSREWLQEQYPKAAVEEIHAAIGGTGSDLGVFRLYNDVLQHHPDLLFVEFAVNDGGASPDKIHQAMEGIVRQTWKADPTIDICYVYTLAQNNLEDLKAGHMQRSASAMEELADLYGIPSIHFGVKVAEMEAAGDLIFKAEKPENPAETRPMVFSTDGVHPLAETGHQLYLEAIERSWPSIKKASGSTGPHPLPAPLRADNWELAKQVPIDPDAMLKGAWEKLPADNPRAKSFQRNMPVLFQAREPGATLSFAFNGTAAAIFDLLGPDGGQVSVQLDDREPEIQKRIDSYCVYHRMSKLNIGADLEPGRHTVKVTLLPDKLDKTKILFEKNLPDLEKHPDKFAGHTWYAGSIMVIGDVE